MAEQIAEPTTNGKFMVNARGLEEFVADKSYHSGSVLMDLRELKVRTCIAEPDRGRRKWRASGESGRLTVQTDSESAAIAASGC